MISREKSVIKVPKEFINMKKNFFTFIKLIYSLQKKPHHEKADTSTCGNILIINKCIF